MDIVDIMREQIDEWLKQGQYDAIKEALESNPQIVEKNNDLEIMNCMLAVCEQEKEGGDDCILFEKVDSLEALVNRYTKLMFYLRRFDFDIADDSTDAFNQFLLKNRVSLQELFIVLYCGAVHKEKVLQIIKDKMARGEITL